MAGGCHVGECRYRPFLPLQKVLLGSDALDSVSQSGGKQDGFVCACKMLQRRRLDSQQGGGPSLLSSFIPRDHLEGDVSVCVPVPLAPSNLSF